MTRRKGLKQRPRQTDALQEKGPISDNRNRHSKGRRRAKLFLALSCFLFHSGFSYIYILSEYPRCQSEL